MDNLRFYEPYDDIRYPKRGGNGCLFFFFIIFIFILILSL